MEVTISKSNYTFVDVSDWLTRLDHSYERARLAGWEFLFILCSGLDQFGRTDPRKMELYELASQQTGLSVKTLQDYVSTARKPSTALAIELGLEKGHAKAVLGLDNDLAEAVLTEAAEQGLSVESTRWRARQYKEPYRDIPIIHPPNGHDDEPPFASSTMYTDEAPIRDLWPDERISDMVAQCQRGDFVHVQDVARLLRTMRDEYEIRLYRR